MKKLRNIHDHSTIRKEIGGDFSFKEKLKLNGTGSPKVIYIKGVPHFNTISESSGSHSFVNFQLYPLGLTAIISKSNKTEAVAIQQKAIQNISIVARRIQVREWSRIRFRYIKKIVHDAQIVIKLDSREFIYFYCLTAHYKEVVKFFQKNWLNEKLSFSIDPSEPIIDNNNLIAGAIFRIVENL